MIKNTIIAALITLLLNTMPDWKCEGFERVLISLTMTFFLVIVFAIIDTAYEEKQRKAENNDRVRKLQSR